MAFSRNPGMKIEGKTADFCDMKEKRGKNEERILMVKKANAFFFSGSSFLFPSSSFFMIFTENHHGVSAATPT
jgi:hypothetical protein